MQQLFDEAISKLERALEHLPLTSPYRLGARINHALVRWDKHGDVATRLAVQTDTLPEVWRLYPTTRPARRGASPSSTAGSVITTPHASTVWLSCSESRAD